MWMELVPISITASLATGSLDSALKQAFRETYLVKREARFADDASAGRKELVSRPCLRDARYASRDTNDEESAAIPLG